MTAARRGLWMAFGSGAAFCAGMMGLPLFVLGILDGHAAARNLGIILTLPLWGLLALRFWRRLRG